jgi:hypothetical protein
MQKWKLIAVLGLSLLAASTANARNVKYILPIAVNADMKNTNLDAAVKLFFGPQPYPAVLQKLGNVSTTNKAHIVDRIDIPACHVAFLAGLQELQKNAKAAGANAVVNIVSYFKNGAPVESPTEFECHAGSNSTILMLKGDLVKIADK